MRKSDTVMYNGDQLYICMIILICLVCREKFVIERCKLILYALRLTITSPLIKSAVCMYCRWTDLDESLVLFYF